MNGDQNALSVLRMKKKKKKHGKSANHTHTHIEIERKRVSEYVSCSIDGIMKIMKNKKYEHGRLQ